MTFGCSKEKCYFFAAMATVYSFIGLILYCMYLAFWPMQALQVLNSPLPVNNSVYRAGDLLVYTAEACRYTDKEILVSRFFVDGLVYAMPVVAVQAPAGRCGAYNISASIPMQLPPGIYHIEFSAKTELNPLRTVVEKWETQKFTVIE